MSDFSYSSDEDIELRQMSDALSAAISLTAGEFTKYRRRARQTKTTPTVPTFNYIRQKEQEQAPDVKLRRVGAVSMFMVPKVLEEGPEECAIDEVAA
jgi:hypothetical protein